MYMTQELDILELTEKSYTQQCNLMFKRDLQLKPFLSAPELIGCVAGAVMMILREKFVLDVSAIALRNSGAASRRSQTQ